MSQIFSSAKIPGDLVIRPIKPEDLPELYEILRDPGARGSLTRLSSVEFSQFTADLEEPSPGYHRLVAQRDSQIAGLAFLIHRTRARLQHSGTIRLGLPTGPLNAQVCAALVEACIDLADRWLNLLRLEIDIFAEELDLKNQLLEMGFDVEGLSKSSIYRAGKWFDEFRLARLRPGWEILTQLSSTASNIPRRDPGDKVKALIRPLAPEDIPGMQQLLSNPAVGRTTLQLPSLELAQAEIRFTSPHPNRHRYVALVEGQLAGSISIFVDEEPGRGHTAGLGMAVLPAYWNRGIGSQLMEAILSLADDWLNLKRVELQVNTDNPAAIHLYEKYGFVIEATLRLQTYGDGRWADTYLMARIRNQD